MARVLVTGSADGLGRLAAQRLVDLGHQVVLHARSAARARDARAAAPGDAVIHNAGVGYSPPRVETADGLEEMFAVNVLAPYLLTALVPARRLVYLSSGMHRGGAPALDDLQWRRRRWSGSQAYSDSKLLDVVLAFAVARRWPGVLANAVDPGWVPTRMGGPGAPDDLAAGAETQVWLAVSDDAEARVSGRYLHHRRPRAASAAASDPALQDRLLRACEDLTGVALPVARGQEDRAGAP